MGRIWNTTRRGWCNTCTALEPGKGFEAIH